MPRYEKSMIRKGMIMTLDCSIRASAPRYGEPDPPDPDFKAISDRLDAARARLEQIAKDFKNARSR